MKRMTGRIAGMRWRLLAASMVTFGLLCPVPANAAPWTLGKGDVTAYVGALWTRSQDFYDADGDRQQYLRDGTSRVYGVNLQGAYGVTDRLMVQAGLPYLWFELADDAVRDAGRSPGDLRVDVRWQPLRVNEFAAAVQAGVKLPTAATAGVDATAAPESSPVTSGSTDSSWGPTSRRRSPSQPSSADSPVGKGALAPSVSTCPRSPSAGSRASVRRWRGDSTPTGSCRSRPACPWRGSGCMLDASTSSAWPTTGLARCS